VYENSPEQIIGIVHLKDLVRVWMQRRVAHEARRPVAPFRLRSVMRKPPVVPETKSLRDLIDEFRARHTHMALVVDEFGTVSGLVTLEDVLEQVFGEIEDEHDIARPKPNADAATIEFEGSITIRDLATQYGIELPSDTGFETLAGFLLFRLGYIPTAGAFIEYGRRRFTVVEMDRKRIARVKIERLPPEPDEDVAVDKL
jgi:putative hemolysin